MGVETLFRLDLLSVPFAIDMIFGTLDCLFFNLNGFHASVSLNWLVTA